MYLTKALTKQPLYQLTTMTTVVIESFQYSQNKQLFKYFCSHSNGNEPISFWSSYVNQESLNHHTTCAGLSVASSDSGIGTPSDHTISVYDYLTLDDPNDDRRPMDSIHLEHLYGRLESYAVDMMLRKIERVSKLSDEVLAVESNLLEVCRLIFTFSNCLKDHRLQHADSSAWF